MQNVVVGKLKGELTEQKVKLCGSNILTKANIYSVILPVLTTTPSVKRMSSSPNTYSMDGTFRLIPGWG